MIDNDNCGRQNRNGGECQLPSGWGTPDDSGACKFHGGLSTGPPKGSQNAKTHGAFTEHFTSDLTQAEQRAFEDAKSALESPKDAQEIARTAAAEVLLKYKRSGDERFIRRFEGLCDKFNLAPDDELSVDHSGDVEHNFGVGELSDDDREFIESLTNE